MADTPKDKEQGFASGAVRWLGLANEAIGKGITNTLAGVGFLAVDSINNAPRLIGLGKMSEKPVGGSDWILEKMAQGKAATDSLTGVVAPVPETTAEKAFSKTVEVATEIAIPLPVKGLSAAAKAAPAATKTVAQSAAKIEPVMGEAASATAQAAATTVKKTASSNLDDISARLAAAKKAGEAERAGQAAGAATDAGKAGAKAADAAADAGKAGAKTADAATNAAKAADPLSWTAARAIMRDSEKGLLTKLKELHEGGRMSMAEDLIYKARINGKINSETVAAAKKFDGMPDSIKTKLADIADARKDPGFFGINRGWDNLKAGADNFLRHPVKSTPEMLWGAFSAQWKIPFGVFKAAKEHKLATGAVIATGAALHGATDGATTRLAGDAINTAGGAYVEADKILAGTAMAAGAGLLNLAATDGAQRFAASASDKATEVAQQTPNFLFSLGAHIAGTTPEKIIANPIQFTNDHPILSYVLLPASVRSALNAAELANKATENQQQNNSQTGTPSPSPSPSPESSLRERAAGAAGNIREQAENAADQAFAGFNIATVMSNPAAAWNTLKAAAKANPQLAGLMEVGEKYPGMKWGIMAGAAIGAFTGEGVGGKMKSAFMSALFLGFVFDLVGSLHGKKSAVMDMVRAIQNPPSPPELQSAAAPAGGSPATEPGVRRRQEQGNSPAIETTVDLRRGFESAQTATTPQDTKAAPAAEGSTLNSAFDRSATTPPAATPAPALAQVGSDTEAANNRIYVIPSYG